jgi:uncharacterized integral membrane protein (TIGR00697 family)
MPIKTAQPGQRQFSLLEPVIAAFVSLILISNIIAQKFFDIQLFGTTFSSDVGTILLFPVTYIFGDVLTEVFGYAVSRRVVWYGFAMNAVAALVFTAAVAMPASAAFAGNEAFAAVLGQMPAMVLASLAGYWCGSFTNDSVLAALKVRMVRWDPKHRFLPLRTIASTVAGELVDTILFVGVATIFGVFPKELFLSLVLTQWAIKTLVEVLLTPVTVLVIRAMKRHEGCDMVGTESWNPFAFRKSGGTNLWTAREATEAD